MAAEEESSMQDYSSYAPNLKILKSWQIQQTMLHFINSLNVKCNFCHNVGDQVDATYFIRYIPIEGNFSQDYSPAIQDENLIKSLGNKNWAREMLRMVNNNNKNYLHWEHRDGRSADKVNCWLCHRATHNKMVSDYKKENQDFIELPF